MHKIISFIITLVLALSCANSAFADGVSPACLVPLCIGGAFGYASEEADESSSDEPIKEWTANLNFYFGEKQLDDRWSPAEDQGELGLMLDIGKKDWPVSIALDVMESTYKSDSSSNFKAGTTEVDLGVRKIFSNDGSLNLYLSGGVAYIEAEAESSVFNSTARVSGDGIGYWLAGGAFSILFDGLNLGLDLRYSSADVEFSGFNEKIDSGGTHFGLIIGYHW